MSPANVYLIHAASSCKTSRADTSVQSNWCRGFDHNDFRVRDAACQRVDVTYIGKRQSLHHFRRGPSRAICYSPNKERSLMGRPARGLMLAADNHRSEERAAKLTIGSAAVTR